MATLSPLLSLMFRVRVLELSYKHIERDVSKIQNFFYLHESWMSTPDSFIWVEQ